MESVIIILLLIFNIILFYFLLKTNSNKTVKSRIKKKPRICPLCGTILKNEEDYIIGEYFESNGKKKVYIYGCPYCYKGKKRKNKVIL